MAKQPFFLFLSPALSRPLASAKRELSCTQHPHFLPLRITSISKKKGQCPFGSASDCTTAAGAAQQMPRQQGECMKFEFSKTSGREERDVKEEGALHIRGGRRQSPVDIICSEAIRYAAIFFRECLFTEQFTFPLYFSLSQCFTLQLARLYIWVQQLPISFGIIVMAYMLSVAVRADKPLISQLYASDVLVIKHTLCLSIRINSCTAVSFSEEVVF